MTQGAESIKSLMDMGIVSEEGCGVPALIFHSESFARSARGAWYT